MYNSSASISDQQLPYTTSTASRLERRSAYHITHRQLQDITTAWGVSIHKQGISTETIPAPEIIGKFTHQLKIQQTGQYVNLKTK
jgi:hypothetical protein